jgi:hypothetical protein
MKKLLLICLIAASLSAQAAQTFTFVINAGTSTNLFPSFNNPVKVTQAAISSGASSQGNATIYDAPTNTPIWAWQAGVPLWAYTNAQFTNVISYATNYYVYYTNFYGVTGYSYTNKALIDVTNLVAQSTNYYNAWLYLAAGTNNTVTYVNLSAVYANGIWATNSGTGPATVTLTIQ